MNISVIITFCCFIGAYQCFFHAKTTVTTPSTTLSRGMSIISSRNSSGGVPIVREANMLKPVQQESINIAQQAIKKYGGYHVGQRSNIAKQIQSDMNRKYGRHWQCIVGNDYGSAIAFKKQNHIVFQIDRAFITLFKGVC